MKRTIQIIERLLSLSRILYLSLFVFFILSCTSLSTTSLFSKKLNYKVRWNYSSSQSSSKSFSSFVFIEGNHSLRLDILQPFIGVVGVFIFSNKVMILLSPFHKKYYKGLFNSQIFFPQFPSFPGSWLVSLLRVQPPEAWSCNKQKEKFVMCKTDHFEIQWIYQRDQLHEVRLTDSIGRQIKAEISRISNKEFSSRLFTPFLKDWESMKEPLFFNAL